MKPVQINSVLLVHPNYTLLGKRSWPLAPYSLALLNACIKEKWNSDIVDFNLEPSDENEIRRILRNRKPDVVAITSFSTEYYAEVHRHVAIIREELPDAIIVGGGAYPTVLPEQAAQDSAADYWIIGEGEYRLPMLLEMLSKGDDPANIDGIAYHMDGTTHINPMRTFIHNLDAAPFPDYGSLDLRVYGSRPIQYAHYLVARNYPFAVTSTSRGCPFKCIFCAGSTVSGSKVRMRSSKNVLDEVRILESEHGIREIVFLDDHFLFSRKRSVEIMKGIRDHHKSLSWKCANVAIFSLDEKLLELKRDSGCYQITVSIESGDQDVLTNIMKKPIKLSQAKRMIKVAKDLNFEIISNFVIGLPGETWEQIRRTIDFAAELDIDLVNFHVATPLPKTRLMEIYKEMGLAKDGSVGCGYTTGVIETDEFTSFDLQVLRAYEWDRINFRTPEKIEKIASLEGVEPQDVYSWRKLTRRNLGSTLGWKHRPQG